MIRPFILTLVVAAIPLAILAYVAHSIGIHSTPGIWLAMFSFPGMILIALTNGSLAGYCVAVLANWLIYSFVVWLVLRLRGARV